MPLNHVAGEQVEDMDAVWRIVPLAKYAEQNRMTTLVEVVEGGKFKRKRLRERPIWETALDHAKRCFYNAGAKPGPLQYDVLVQEYPRTGCICFVFLAMVGDVEHFVTAPFKLGDDQLASLAARNLWPAYRLN